MALALLTGVATGFAPQQLPRHHVLGRARAGLLASPVCMADSPLDDFHAWLKADGLDSAKVSSANVDGFGTSLVATEPLKAGDAVLAVPRRLHLTAKAAEGTDMGTALTAAGVLSLIHI